MYSVVNDTSVSNTAINVDNELDHTYDTAEYHKQASNCYNEQPQYNTLQHGSIQTSTRSPTFDVTCIDTNTSNGVQNRSILSTDIQRGSHKTNSGGKYDHVDNSRNHPPTSMKGSDGTNHTIPQDYEPVYHEPNYTQVDKPTGNHDIVLFDDETCGTY